MPRILELKEIDGKLWAALDLPVPSDDEPGCVHLLTDDEVQAIRKDEREGNIEVVSWFSNVEKFTAQDVIDRIRSVA